MPYKSAKHKTRHQRQQRRVGEVKRVEIVLSAQNDRDHDIHDFLANLPRGEVSEFIKTAILEKMQRDGQRPAIPEAPSAAEQFNTILAELAALRKAVTPTATRVTSDVPHEQASSGIDMSAPRRRAAPVSRAPITPIPVAEPFNEAEARRKLVESINNFGKNQGR